MLFAKLNTQKAQCGARRAARRTSGLQAARAGGSSEPKKGATSKQGQHMVKTAAYVEPIVETFDEDVLEDDEEEEGGTF